MAILLAWIAVKVERGFPNERREKKTRGAITADHICGSCITDSFHGVQFDYSSGFLSIVKVSITPRRKVLHPKCRLADKFDFDD